MPVPKPSASIIVREHHDRPFYEAKFRYRGRQIKRRIGPAWLERDPDTGGWRRHRGRLAEGSYDERAAHVAAAQLVDEYVDELAASERDEHERRSRGVMFREVAHAYLRWLKDVAGAKPSTLRDHRNVLCEPGVPHKRGQGTTAGHVMAALGNRPAAKITTREIEDELREQIERVEQLAAVVRDVASSGAFSVGPEHHKALFAGLATARELQDAEVARLSDYDPLGQRFIAAHSEDALSSLAWLLWGRVGW